MAHLITGPRMDMSDSEDDSENTRSLRLEEEALMQPPTKRVTRSAIDNLGIADRLVENSVTDSKETGTQKHRPKRNPRPAPYNVPDPQNPPPGGSGQSSESQTPGSSQSQESGGESSTGGRGGGPPGGGPPGDRVGGGGRRGGRDPPFNPDIRGNVGRRQGYEGPLRQGFHYGATDEYRRNNPDEWSRELGLFDTAANLAAI